MTWRQQRAERLAAGLCAYCGQPRADRAVQRCEDCRAREKQRAPKYQRRGCNKCGKPTRPWQRRCAKCVRLHGPARNYREGA